MTKSLFIRDRRLEPTTALALIVALALCCFAYAYMPVAQAAGEPTPSLPVQRVVVEVHVVQVAPAPVHHAHHAHHCTCH
jgi:hypothetical protein